jgi:hypothetical protein
LRPSPVAHEVPLPEAVGIDVYSHAPRLLAEGVGPKA